MPQSYELPLVQSAPAAVTEPVAAVAHETVTASAVTADTHAAAEPVAALEPPVVVKTPVVVESSILAQVPAAAEAPTAPAPMPVPPPAPKAIAPIEMPAFDPREYVASAGLQLVETRSGAAHAAVPELEAVKLGRPRREHPRLAAEEALVQVETRDK